MGVIKWVGESDHWVVPDCEGNPKFLMPLTERSVLEVATTCTSARELPLKAALNCTSRLALRVALAATNLNPKWHPFEWGGPSVIKAPASSANLGVAFLPPTEYIDYLQAAAPDLARFGVVEERVEGPQYELDGFVVRGEVSPFCPLLQHWNEDGDKILGYERKEPPGREWFDACLAAIHAVGITDAPFCIELRYDMRRGVWKIIEINARLGEDPGLASLMCDEYPLDVIAEACAAAAHSTLRTLSAAAACTSACR